MSVLTDSNNINFEVCHRVSSQSVYTLVSLIQAMLNMSTLSTNDQGKSFWELVYGSVNQVLADHCRWHQLWRSPFPVTLQRIFNTRFKKLSLVVFCCDFWTLQQKLHDYICGGCKNMVSQNVQFLLGHPVFAVLLPRVRNVYGSAMSSLVGVTVIIYFTGLQLFRNNILCYL